SEPPTHDDWVHERLDVPKERTFVNVALKRIRYSVKNFIGAVAGFHVENSETGNLGGLSAQLGGLLTATSGTGLGPGRTERAPGEKRRTGGGRKPGSGRSIRQLPLRRSVEGTRIRVEVPFQVHNSDP